MHCNLASPQPKLLHSVTKCYIQREVSTFILAGLSVVFDTVDHSLFLQTFPPWMFITPHSPGSPAFDLLVPGSFASSFSLVNVYVLQDSAFTLLFSALPDSLGKRTHSHSVRFSNLSPGGPPTWAPNTKGSITLQAFHLDIPWMLQIEQVPNWIHCLYSAFDWFFSFVSLLASPSHQSNKPVTWNIFLNIPWNHPCISFTTASALIQTYPDLPGVRTIFLTSKYIFFSSGKNLIFSQLHRKSFVIWSHLPFHLHLSACLISSHTELPACPLIWHALWSFHALVHAIYPARNAFTFLANPFPGKPFKSQSVLTSLWSFLWYHEVCVDVSTFNVLIAFGTHLCDPDNHLQFNCLNISLLISF